MKGGGARVAPPGWTARSGFVHSDGRMRPLSLACLLAAAVAGCAASTMVTLRHEVPPGARAEREAAPVRVTAGDARPQAASGSAQARLVVGTAPDPIEIGPPPPDYTVAEPIQAAFAKALEAELAARGFRVGDGAGVLVRLEIRRFFSEGRRKLVGDVAGADLEMDVTVATASGEARYSRRIVQHAEAPVGVAGLTRTGTVQAVLQRAMDDGFAVLLGDEAFLRALRPPTGSS